MTLYKKDEYFFYNPNTEFRPIKQAGIGFSYLDRKSVGLIFRLNNGKTYKITGFPNKFAIKFKKINVD